MDSELNRKYTDLHGLLREIVLDKFQNRNSLIVKKCVEIENRINNQKVYLNSSSDDVISTQRKKVAFKSEIEELIIDFRKVYALQVEELNTNVESLISKQILNTNQLIVKEQLPVRFKLLKEDTIFLSFFKVFKIAFFHISKMPLLLVNLFRKLFRKQKLPIRYWQHKIKIDLLFLSDVIIPVKETIAEIEKDYIVEAENYIDLLQNQISHFDLYPSYFESESTDFEEKISNVVKVADQKLTEQKENLMSPYRSHIERIGTLELPIWYFRWKTKRHNLIANNQLQSVQKSAIKEWDKQLSAWQFKVKLSSIATEISIPKFEFQHSFTAKVNNSIKPYIEDLSAIVVELKDDLNKIPEDNEDLLKSYTVQGVYKMNKTLTPKIQELSNLNFAQQIMNSSGYMEGKIQDITSKVLDTKKNEDKSNEFPYVSIFQLTIKPYLINTLFPSLQKDMSALKLEFSKGLEQLALIANDLHHILDFCFDNALEIIESDSEQIADQDALEILHSGFENALSKVSALFEEVKKIEENFLRPTLKHLANYSNEVENLYFEKNINEIYLKVAKSNVIKRSNWLKELTAGLINALKNKTKAISKLYIVKANSLVGKLKKKLHLLPSNPTITSELSNFLIETRESINNLPLVYKRLFELKPIDETNLFIGRNQEIAKLNNAYRDWQNGNYAATVVVGENGSGKSSLINYFINNVKSKYKVTKYHVDKFHTTQEDFFRLVSEILGAEIDSEEDLRDYFQKNQPKKVIVIDGMERLFLRKINGTSCLQRFLDLIVETNQQVFWLFVSAKYAWRYISVIYHAQDYFDHRVEIEDFKPQEIQDVIFKRNRLSGYTVKYENSDNVAGRKFSKLSDEAKQIELELRYFQRLNQFAQSNLSLALSFWLVSIKKVEGNNLLIATFKAPEFTFLQNLSNEKAKTLLAIVMHGKIDSEALSSTLNIYLHSAKRLLSILKEDGVLTFSNDFYYLHPILYRHIVSMLKARNLLN